MKKLTAFLLILTIAASLTVSALAADYQNESVIGTTYTNEYDYIMSIQNANANELSEMGLSADDAAAIVEAFETALHERASLPEETLIGYGYTEDEISTLRLYNARAVLTSEDMRAITGTCTGEITASYLTDTKATFKYAWEWDHAPIMKLTDSAAMRWLAFDSNGYDFDVTKTSAITRINYYWNGSKQFYRTGTEEPDLEFNSINIQFDESELFQSSTTMTEEAYAGDGYIQISVKVEPEVDNTISYLKVAALYGHTTIGMGPPSISLSPLGDISISFNGNVSIDPVGAAKVKIAHGSSNYSPVVTDIK